MTKIYGLQQLSIVCTFFSCAISIGSYTPIKECYSVIIFNLPINAAILLLHCLVLILYLHIFLSLKHYCQFKHLVEPLHN